MAYSEGHRNGEKRQESPAKRLGERPDIEEAVEELEKRARGWLESDEERQSQCGQKSCTVHVSLWAGLPGAAAGLAGACTQTSPTMSLVLRRTFAPVSKRVPAAVVAVEGAFVTNAILIMSMLPDLDMVQRYTAVSSGARPAKAKAFGPAVRNGFSALA